MKPDKTALGIVAATAAALLATTSAPALGTSHVRSATEPTPQLSVTMSGKNSALTVTGSRQFSAGRVAITLTAVKGEQAFDIIRLHTGYTYADFKHDFETYGRAQNNPTPAALKALNHLVHHTTFYGGFDTGGAHLTVNGTVVLPEAATYYMIADSNGPNLAVAPVKLHVSAKTGDRAAPASSGTQVATTAKRFTGPVNLPAQGTIAFHNASTESPHFMFLQHVKKGTTRKQVIKSLQSNGPGPSLPGAVGVDVVSPRHTVTLTYRLPAGDYAEMCFFPDLKTGMPHAFMGMVRIVHLS